MYTACTLVLEVQEPGNGVVALKDAITQIQSHSKIVVLPVFGAKFQSQSDETAVCPTTLSSGLALREVSTNLLGVWPDVAHVPMISPGLMHLVGQVQYLKFTSR